MNSTISVVTSSLVVLLAGYAAAAPGKAATHKLIARDSVSCGLGNYPDATYGPIRVALPELEWGAVPNVLPGQQGARVACSYGTGGFVSVDNDRPTVTGAEASLPLNAAFE